MTEGAIKAARGWPRAERLGANRPAPRLSERTLDWLWRLGSLVIVFGLWEIAGRIPISPVFPAFTETLAALGGMIGDGSLAAAYSATLPPLIVGTILIAVAGVLAGVAMGAVREIEWLLLPLFIVLQTAPVAALIPMITYLYGVGFTSKLISIVVLSMPLVAINCYKGFRNTNRSLSEMCRSFLGTRRQEIIKILLPQAAPLIFGGLRLGIAAGILAVILSEMLITPTGIGDLIAFAGSRFEYDQVYAAILSIIVLSSGLLGALQAIERRLVRKARLGAPQPAAGYGL